MQQEPIRTQAQGARDQESISSILSGLLRDLQDLVRDEVRLAKAEVKEDVQTASRAAAMLAIGAVLGLTGLIILLMGVSILLAEEIEGWLAFGTVGLVTLILAAILAMVGKNRLSAANLKPEQTIESMKENKEWASQQIKSAKN